MEVGIHTIRVKASEGGPMDVSYYKDLKGKTLKVRILGQKSFLYGVVKDYCETTNCWVLNTDGVIIYVHDYQYFIVVETIPASDDKPPSKGKPVEV